jgi:hypothetical protein
MIASSRIVSSREFKKKMAPDFVPEGRRILAGDAITGEHWSAIRALEGRRTEAVSVALSGLEGFGHYGSDDFITG